MNQPPKLQLSPNQGLASISNRRTGNSERIPEILPDSCYQQTSTSSSRICKQPNNLKQHQPPTVLPVYMRQSSHLAPIEKQIRFQSKVSCLPLSDSLSQKSYATGLSNKNNVSNHFFNDNVSRQGNLMKEKRFSCNYSKVRASEVAKKIVEETAITAHHEKREYEAMWKSQYKRSNSESLHNKATKEHRFIVTICDGQLIDIAQYCETVEDSNSVFDETTPIAETVTDELFPRSTLSPQKTGQLQEMQKMSRLLVPQVRRRAVSGHSSSSSSHSGSETTDKTCHRHRRKAVCSATDEFDKDRRSMCILHKKF